MYVHVSVCKCMYVYACVRMCIHVYVCVCMNAARGLFFLEVVANLSPKPEALRLDE